MQRCPMGLQKVFLAAETLELTPETTAGITIGPKIAQPHPTIIGTARLGTELLRGIHLARPSLCRGKQRGWDKLGWSAKLRGLLTSSTAGSVGGPGKGFGPRERCWSGVAGLRMVGQVADWFRAHPLYRMPPSHRRTIRRKSWKRTLSTIAFPFSSGKMMIDYLILRQGTYPQGRGTRPSHTVL